MTCSTTAAVRDICRSDAKRRSQSSHSQKNSADPYGCLMFLLLLPCRQRGCGRGAPSTKFRQTTTEYGNGFCSDFFIGGVQNPWMHNLFIT